MENEQVRNRPRTETGPCPGIPLLESGGDIALSRDIPPRVQVAVRLIEAHDKSKPSVYHASPMLQAESVAKSPRHQAYEAALTVVREYLSPRISTAKPQTDAAFLDFALTSGHALSITRHNESRGISVLDADGHWHSLPSFVEAVRWLRGKVNTPDPKQTAEPQLI